jgi:hypothetical protein
MSGVRGLVSGFFRELSPSHRHELLTGLHLALGDRPVADVLLDPERSALMGQSTSTRPSRLRQSRMPALVRPDLSVFTPYLLARGEDGP